MEKNGYLSAFSDCICGGALIRQFPSFEAYLISTYVSNFLFLCILQRD